MPRDEASLLDIFRAGQRIVEFPQGLSRANLETDAMRLSAIDIIAHQYDRLDLDVVWTMIQRSIPELLEMIAPLLPEPME